MVKVKSPVKMAAKKAAKRAPAKKPPARKAPAKKARAKKRPKKLTAGGVELTQAPLGASYVGEYSDAGFWAKVRDHAADAGKAVLTPALKLYYALLDADTPLWARTTITGALGYFVFPLDAVPDVIPVMGYSDDAVVLAAALAVVAAHIKPAHAKSARETLKEWFG